MLNISLGITKTTVKARQVKPTCWKLCPDINRQVVLFIKMTAIVLCVQMIYKNKLIPSQALHTSRKPVYTGTYDI